eukprot:CAMPEP_0194285938 /NCGR_PEP_ID=MMETSP0169-20130528/31364_1 /TAXON_ID=218684 /ORGANISM="Corethron pennatum, Strain L29A3" /LENGTH=76 /DNA_ID=CAMNT_0039032195 /DNA_START=224 /DNA_END=454 /DNA_ORIENTATION=-
MVIDSADGESEENGNRGTEILGIPPNADATDDDEKMGGAVAQQDDTDEPSLAVKIVFGIFLVLAEFFLIAGLAGPQ